MNLTQEEFNRMMFLLGKSKHQILNLGETKELRTLIFKEQKHCPLDFEEMIKYGLLIVGVNTVLEEYKEENK